MLIKELQTVTVNLDRTPGMRFNQFGKVDLQLLRAQPVRTAIVVLRYSTHRAGVDVNGAVTQASKLQSTHMALVQRVESNLFIALHDKLLCR